MTAPLANIDRSDYINPIDLCNRLNTYIVPEAAVHAFLTFLFLINGYWLALVLNLPLLAFNAKKYVGIHRAGSTCADKLYSRIFENQHLLDATEIFRKLNVHKKVCIRLFIPYCGWVEADMRFIGIFHQAWLPLDNVLLLSLQHDRCSHQRRIELTTKQNIAQNTVWKLRLF
jgi:hypothetical protein